MIIGICFSAGFILLGILAYAVMGYNRKREAFKFFACNIGIFVLALVYAFVSTASIPDEICRTGYKFRFGSNIVIATSVFGLIFFILASNVLGAKKYFARIHEYFRK
ncbi:MAG: hypothetical protein PHU69_10555 [Fermentimonas sp.]|nr:hypothetical protein [Fermentimonas sp.]